MEMRGSSSVVHRPLSVGREHINKLFCVDGAGGTGDGEEDGETLLEISFSQNV